MPPYIKSNTPTADIPKVLSVVSRVFQSDPNLNIHECQATPDVATVNAARESAKNAISEMSFVAAPVQSMASVVGGTDNPMGVVDRISSFLTTLEKFNAVVDKIATVSITFAMRIRRCS